VYSKQSTKCVYNIQS